MNTPTLGAVEAARRVLEDAGILAAHECEELTRAMLTAAAQAPALTESGNEISPSPGTAPTPLPVGVIVETLAEHQRGQSLRSNLVVCQCPWSAEIPETHSGGKLHTAHQAQKIQDAHRHHIYETTGLWPYVQAGS